MPSQWGNNQWGPPAPPKPPLMILPQVGPTEQMMHRALRERGLDKPAWDLARKTHTSLVPAEDIDAGGLYHPDTKEIQVGYYGPGGMQNKDARTSYAHELRHAYQDTPGGQNHVSFQDVPANSAYMADAEKWAGSDVPYGELANRMFTHLQGNQTHYGGVASPHELDAYMSAAPGITSEQMPAYMQKYYDGWWKAGAQPDSAELMDSRWKRPEYFEDGSVGRSDVPLGKYSPRVESMGPRNQPAVPAAVPRTWFHRAADEWRSGIKPDANGLWG